MEPKQLALFNDVMETFVSEDDWETPDPLAQFAANFVEDDPRILSPGAGRGQIEKFLSEDTTIYAIEKNHGRYLQGRHNVPNATWLSKDFLTCEPFALVDAVVCNPPFSLGIEFIERSLRWLDPANDEAGLVFILPLDFFCSQKRGTSFGQLNCHIHNVYPIVGRVAFLRNGVPENKPQRYHAVFDIRPGKNLDSKFALSWI